MDEPPLIDDPPVRCPGLAPDGCAGRPLIDEPGPAFAGGMAEARLMEESGVVIAGGVAGARLIDEPGFCPAAILLDERPAGLGLSRR